MRTALLLPAAMLATGLATAPTAAARADTTVALEARSLWPDYLQCVPYARAVSGVSIFGDAWTWWDQAEGRYARGSRPKVGAVMAFLRSGRMQLGHVAVVSRVIDSRRVLLRHANWSPINGTRGQIETDVPAIDVSPDNTWSHVRVWFAQRGDLGTTRWPLAGFIYPEKAGKGGREVPVMRLAGGRIGTRGGEISSGRSSPRDPIGEIIARAQSRGRLASAGPRARQTGEN